VSAGAARRGVSSPLGPRSAPTSCNTPRNMKEPFCTALRAAAAALYPVSAFATARTARPLRCSASVREYPSQVFILTHLPVRARPARAPSPARAPLAAPGQRRPRTPRRVPAPRAGAARMRAPVAPVRPRPARAAAAPRRPVAPRAAAAARRCAPNTYAPAPAPPHGSARALTGPPHFLAGPPRGGSRAGGASVRGHGKGQGEGGAGGGGLGGGAPREEARLPRGVVQPPREHRGTDARVGSERLQRRRLLRRRSEWLQRRRRVRRRLTLGDQG
jgi:hypothetical protein